MPSPVAQRTIDVEELWDNHSELVELIECDQRGDVTVIKRREFVKAITPLLAQLSALREASEWVSVDDDKPDWLLPCEAQTSEGDTYLAHRESDEQGDTIWWSRNQKQEIYHVVRWRPLPPQPASAGKDE